MEANSTTTGMLTAAEIQLIYKSNVRASQRPVANSSRRAYEVLLASWDEGTIEYIEQFKILLLNTAKRVLGVYEVSSGGTDFTPVDPKLIFTAALKCNACGIILAHCHPSGTLRPSDADVLLTKRLMAGGELLGTYIIDHLIITTEGYYSFRDEGLL